MIRRFVALAAVAGLTTTAFPAHADILAESDRGFHVRTIVEAVPVPPESVRRAMAALPRWWPERQRYSNGRQDLTLDLRPGGCLCERMANGGGIQHMTVTRVLDNEVWMSGALGPLGEYGLAGSLHFVWGSAEGGSFVTVDYVVGGYVPPPHDMHRLALQVEGLVAEQAQALAAYAEAPATAANRPRSPPAPRR